MDVVVPEISRPPSVVSRIDFPISSLLPPNVLVDSGSEGCSGETLSPEETEFPLHPEKQEITPIRKSNRNAVYGYFMRVIKVAGYGQKSLDGKIVLLVKATGY
jgi:hypothetical protein